MRRAISILLLLLCAADAAATSTCYGTTENGRLEGAVQLPAEGPNYESYSILGRLLGRTYVHEAVEKIVIGAYKALESKAPGKIYKYAETGLEAGGRFRPHKTHQNGLSVDFMVPVKSASGVSVALATNPFNKFGYNIEFDETGKYDGLEIDYEAMAAHIALLHQLAVENGYDLWRVIFAPELQAPLFDTKYGEYIRQHISFSKKRSWVRHDEHYHVDFKVPCKNAS